MREIILMVLFAPGLIVLTKMSAIAAINYYRARRDRPKSASAREFSVLASLHALSNLLLETLAVLVWLYSRAWLRLHHRFAPPPPIQVQVTEPLLVLVHGYLDDASSWWYLKRRLSRAGYSQMLEVSLFPARASIEQLAVQLHQSIQACNMQDEIICIGHSMGGLVSSLMFETYTPHNIVKIITLGSPLYGSYWATWALGANAYEMRLQSTLLSALRSKMKARPEHYFHLAARYDHVVTPWTSALLWTEDEAPYASHQAVINWGGHAGLLYSAEAAQVIRDQIRDALKLPFEKSG